MPALLRQLVDTMVTGSYDSPSLSKTTHLVVRSWFDIVFSQSLLVNAQRHSFSIVQSEFDDVVAEITVAVSATTVLIDRQMNGYAYLPYH